ncbi:MAG TPA: hypothetical protein VGN14_15825, partial [Candidatus Elarobacter sp.]
MLAAALTSCGGASTGAQPPMSPIPPGGMNPSTSAPVSTPTPVDTATPAPTASPTSAPAGSPGPTAAPADARLHVPQGFAAAVIANVGGARELAALPNGDLIVGTGGTRVAIVPNAEASGIAGTPATFATMPEGPAQGVAYGGGAVFVATEHHVYRIAYASGAQSGTATQ